MKTLTLVAVFAASSLAAQPPWSSPIATGTLVVRGRCVDLDTGEPLSRCRVQLTGHQSTGYALAWARADWADPPEVTTAADGTFRFELRLSAADEELDRGRFHVNIAHPHHAGWFSHCAFFIAVAQGGVDYGDVRLPKGVWPRIRCEDTNGVPQPGVTLYLRGATNEAWRHVTGDGPHSWVDQSAYDRTDIDGVLHLDGPLPAGDYQLSVRGRDALKVPAAVTLPHRDTIVAVIAPVDRAMSISGRLVDDAGQPVEGALLSDGDDSPVSCVTRRDGAFTLIRGKDRERSAASLSLAQNRRYDGWVSLGQVEWGAHDVALTVPANTLHTFVVRTPDGAPVVDFNLYCKPRGGLGRPGGVQLAPGGVRLAPGGIAPGGVRLAGSFAGGRATCRLPAGDYELLVVPRSDRLLATEPRAITIDADKPEVVVDVPAAIARTVDVLFAADRKPAAGVLVEAIEGDEPGPFEWVRPATSVDPPSNAPARRHLVASAPTDERGRATLQLRAPARLHVRVSGPGVRTCVREVDFANGAPAAPILVESGATLIGSVGPVEMLRTLDPGHEPRTHPSIYAYHSWYAPTLTVVYDGGKLRREGVRLDTKGRFCCDGLPPGPIEVQLRRWERFNGNSHRLVAEPTPLGSFTLRVGAPEQVTLRLP